MSDPVNDEEEERRRRLIIRMGSAIAAFCRRAWRAVFGGA